MEASNPSFVGIHGGWTNIPHDHLDLGEFVFETDGVIWAEDLGRDAYTLPGYFDERGYQIYRKRAEGHNCIVINPEKYGHSEYYGQELGARAELILWDTKDKAAMAAYDLTPAYVRDTDKYIRGYYFGDNRNTLMIQDEIKLKDSDSELYWFMHSAQNIEVLSNTKAVMTSKDGKKLIVDVECSIAGYELKVMEAKPLPSSPVVEGQNNNEGYSKLAIHIPQASQDVRITVKLSPDNNKYMYSGLKVSPISEWNLPDGLRPELPTVKAMSINGVPYTNFAPQRNEYIIDIPFGTETAPIISASSDMGIVSVKQAESIYDKAIITLNSDGFNPITYTVGFSVDMDRFINITDNLQTVIPSTLASGSLVTPISADKQTNPVEEETADKMIDNIASTIGTQEGTGLWFEFDLGEIMDIQGIAMSLHSGDKRRAKYELLYSEDGYNFTRVFIGESTGTTSGYEYLLIPGRARYIRIIGNGNTSSLWNSISEFRAVK